MPEPDPRSEATSLETRLEAMDRRLRELQEQLGSGPPVRIDASLGSASRGSPAHAPYRVVAASEGDGLPDAPPPPPPAARSDGIPGVPPPPAQLEVLAELYGKLVASMRELLGGYELVAEQLLPARASDGDPAGEPAHAALSAGPFDGTAALREFEQALTELPGVEAVALRGYEADNRAIIDVQLR